MHWNNRSQETLKANIIKKKNVKSPLCTTAMTISTCHAKLHELSFHSGNPTQLLHIQTGGHVGFKNY